MNYENYKVEMTEGERKATDEYTKAFSHKCE
jgi:hypothetical protein